MFSFHRLSTACLLHFIWVTLSFSASAQVNYHHLESIDSAAPGIFNLDKSYKDDFIFEDITGDGFPDLLFAGDTGVLPVYLNNGKGEFFRSGNHGLVFTGKCWSS